MPWPGTPTLMHSPASWPGTGLAGGSAPAACSAATTPPGPSAINAQVGRAGGRVLEVVLRDGRPAAEDPSGDEVEQELGGAVCVPGHGDLRRRDLRVQVDAGGRFAGGRGQVKPADMPRRVRAQHEQARRKPAAALDQVPGTVIIDGPKRAEQPAGHGEPRAVRGRGEERLTTGYLAEPAGLTARARLEARPEAGAANLLAQLRQL